MLNQSFEVENFLILMSFWNNTVKMHKVFKNCYFKEIKQSLDIIKEYLIA